MEHKLQKKGHRGSDIIKTNLPERLEFLCLNA